MLSEVKTLAFSTLCRKSVLILIVMEHALGGINLIEVTEEYLVLILIVMEHALGEPKKVSIWKHWKES